jgi:hypothetical protein
VILLLIGHLVLSWAVGVALTFVTRMPWRLEDRVIAGLPLGFAAAAMLTWLVAIPFGMSAMPVMLGALLMALGLGAALRFTGIRSRLRPEVADLVARSRRLEPLPLAILLIGSAVFFLAFYTHALVRQADGLYAGHVNIWGDWTTHLSLTGYLAVAQNLLPPENPFYAGTHITYSFLPDFHSGILTHLGLSLPDSLAVTSAILSIALVGVFYGTALRLTGLRWAAFAATLIFFVGGGLAFTWLPGDINATGDGIGGLVGGIAQLVAAPPHDYTWATDSGVWWRTPFVAFLMPQRTVLFGWALGLIALSILWHGWRNRERQEMLVAGALVGLLPLFHVATYADLAIFSIGLALLSITRIKDWLAFALPAVVLGLPQVLMILPPPEMRHGFGGVQLGWMASTTGRSDNILWFWIFNTALLIPLAISALVVRGWAPAGLRRFLLPAWLLFVIPNVYVLAPWDFDNTKFLMWWAMPAAILAGLALARLAGLGRALAVVAVLLLAVQVTSGALDLDRAVQFRLQGLRYLDNDELAVASWASAHTELDSVFLTGWQNNQPILTLSQRVEVMGFPTWLWSWDIDYRGRQQDVIAMFQGGPQTDLLLSRYNVRYVVIGPHELSDVGANLAYFKGRYPVAYLSPTGEYEVFRVG